MHMYTPEELEAMLRKRNGFFRGLWLLACLCGQFIRSLGPQNWNFQKITNSGRVDPLADQEKSAIEVLVQPAEHDRKHS